MDLQELKNQYEAAKKALQDLHEQILHLCAEAQESAPVEAEEVVVEAPVTETPQPAPAPQHEAAPSADVQALNAKLEEMAQTNSAIMVMLKEMQEAQKEKIDAVEEQNDIKQERLEKIIQTVQEDRFRKDKLKLINRCIFHADLIRKTIYEYPEIKKELQTEEEKEAFFLKQLNNIVIGIESMLADEGAKVRHFAAVGEKINTEYQEVVGTRETNDEALNGTVAESVSPGYVWTLPYILKAKLNENGDEVKHYTFLMQTEQIIAYKYVKQQ